jgi:hypothetical protein
MVDLLLQGQFVSPHRLMVVVLGMDWIVVGAV